MANKLNFDNIKMLHGTYVKKDTHTHTHTHTISVSYFRPKYFVPELTLSGMKFVKIRFIKYIIALQRTRCLTITAA